LQLTFNADVKPGAMAGAPADSATPSSLPTNEMWLIGYTPLFRAEVKIIQPERLLKGRRGRAFRDGELHRIDVAHVNPPDHVTGIGKSVRVFVVGRTP
jgi:hypothetical protein